VLFNTARIAYLISRRQLCTADEIEVLLVFEQLDHESLFKVFEKWIVWLFPEQVAKHVFFLFDTEHIIILVL
jgi:hypothetical protein